MKKDGTLSKKEIKEANLLIGRFDNWIHCGLGGNLANVYIRGDQTRHIDSFEYHWDWNWLIPVCRKWDRLNISKDKNGKLHSEYVRLCEYLDNEMTKYDLESVFLQLIECIKWYNEKFNIKVKK